MRRFITIACVCASILAHAQNIITAEYFFDSDPGPGNGIPVTFTAGDSVIVNTSISSSGLQPGYHHLFIRTKNTAGKWSLYEGRTFYIKSNIPPASQIIAAEYFFNMDPGVGNGTSISVAAGDSVQLTTTIATTGLQPGFHNLFVRTQNSAGQWSLHEGRTFHVISPATSSQLVAAEYFFDTDNGAGTGTGFAGIIAGDSIVMNTTVSASGLANGIHNVFIRAKDGSGKWGLYEGRQFTVCGQVPDADFSVVNSCTGDTASITDLSSNVATGASYSWDVQNDGVLDYSTAGNISHIYSPDGTYTIKLVIDNGSGCLDSVLKVITVFPLPVINFVMNPDSLCSVSPPVAISGGTPAGGNYSGYGVSGGNFDPSVTGSGTYPVTYTYTDNNGCTNSASVYMQVEVCSGISNATAESGVLPICVPNPTSGKFTLHTSLSDGNLKVRNILGQEIHSGFINEEIDLTNQGAGTYFIEITSGNSHYKTIILKE